MSIDLSNVRKIQKVTSIRRGGHGKLAIQIVNSINGRRIGLSHCLFEQLGMPDEVCFAVDGDKLLVGTNVDEDKYKVSTTETKHLIYSAEIVFSLTEELGLKFGTGEASKTSVTFDDIRMDDADGKPVAVVTIPRNNTEE